MKRPYIKPAIKTMMAEAEQQLLTASVMELEVKGNYEDNNVTDLSRQHHNIWEDEE